MDINVEVIIKVDARRRMRVYQEGGMDLEAYVEGIGWVLDNDADVSDNVIQGHLQAAIDTIQRSGIA